MHWGDSEHPWVDSSTEKCLRRSPPFGLFLVDGGFCAILLHTIHVHSFSEAVFDLCARCLNSLDPPAKASKAGSHSHDLVGGFSGENLFRSWYHPRMLFLAQLGRTGVAFFLCPPPWGSRLNRGSHCRLADHPLAKNF